MNIEHTIEREKKLQDLCASVLKMKETQGLFSSCCKFCHVEAKINHVKNSYIDMSELPHKQNCAYIIAEQLTSKNEY